jgi:hypothetical protein
MRQLADIAIADDDVVPPGLQRLDQPRDLVPAILVIGIGVDDEVGALAQRGVDTGRERGGQAALAIEADHMMHAMRVRDVRGPVGGPVVDDQVFDHVDARQRSRQIGQCRRQRGGLVQTRNLDDEFGH